MVIFSMGFWAISSFRAWARACLVWSEAALGFRSMALSSR